MQICFMAHLCISLVSKNHISTKNTYLVKRQHDGEKSQYPLVIYDISRKNGWCTFFQTGITGARDMHNKMQAKRMTRIPKSVKVCWNSNVIFLSCDGIIYVIRYYEVYFGKYCSFYALLRR